MKITRSSPFTGIVATLDLSITGDQYTAWKRGVLSQNAFPQLDADEREFIQTGILPGEWKERLGEGE